MFDILSQKQCKQCGEWKDKSEFYVYKRNGRLRPCCKACMISSYKNWTVANPERRREIAKAWKNANPEKVREERRQYRAKKEGQRLGFSINTGLQTKTMNPCWLLRVVFALSVKAKTMESDYMLTMTT